MFLVHSCERAQDGYCRFKLSGILYVHETLQQFFGLVNVTRASIDEVVGSKRLQFQFGMNYAFKNHTYSS